MGQFKQNIVRNLSIKLLNTRRKIVVEGIAQRNYIGSAMMNQINVN